MRLGSHAQLGAVLFAVACNSVLGIEPGAYVGQAGAAGSSGVAPLAGGARDAGSGTGGERDAGPGTGGERDAGPGAGGAHDAGTARGGTYDAGSGPGRGGDAGAADEAQAGALPASPGGASGVGGSGVGGNPSGGGGRVPAAGGASGGVAGEAAECAVGQTQCSGRILQTCGKDGRWTGNTECSYACLPKQDGSRGHECGGGCVPGDSLCESATELKICDKNGEWSLPTPCVDQACTGKPPGCRGSCSPGATWCDSATVLVSCDDTGTPHSASCAEDHGNACVEAPAGSGTYRCSGECVPDRLQCSENTVQSCTDRGTWEDRTACDGQTCVESSETAGCQGECAPDQLRCDDQGEPQMCKGGEWVLAGSCSSSEDSFQVCREGRCELADHFVGPSEPYDDTVNAIAGYLIACPLPQLQHDAILLHFNVIGGPYVEPGVAARMVLYEDDGSGVAPGGDPVAQTAGTLFQLLPRQVSVGTSETEPRLKAATTYWVGIVTAQNTSVRGLSGSLGTGLCRRWELDFAEAFGAPETGILVENTDVNLFLEVRDID